MSDKIAVKYFGNSAFQIITEGGKKILIDPCLTGANIYGDQRHGVTQFSPDDIDGVDVIFVTHAASDHLGDTFELASRMKCRVICDPAAFWYLRTLGLERGVVKQTMYGKQGEAGGVKFQTVYSSHMSFLNEPFLKLTGVSLGFIIYSDTGRGIYAPGDTAIMTDIKLYAELYKPEIGLLGIGGFTGGEGTLTSYEAALIAKWMDLKVAIPHHYRESRFPEEFKSEMKTVSPGTRAVVLAPGGEIDL